MTRDEQILAAAKVASAKMAAHQAARKVADELLVKHREAEVAQHVAANEARDARTVLLDLLQPDLPTGSDAGRGREFI